MAAVNTIDSLHSAEIKMGIEFRLWMDQIFEFRLILFFSHL